MKNLLNNIDLLRLAGITTILGVDRTAQYLRCAVLKRTGNPLNRLSGGFVAVDSFSILLDEGSTIQNQSERLRDVLNERKIKIRYAVSSIRTLGIKVVTAAIPATVDDIHAWILERLDKLLRLPVPASQVTFRYEILDRTSDGKLAEITFARNADIEEYRSFFSRAGLELIALGAGARDASNAIVVASPSLGSEVIDIVFDEENSICAMKLVHGKKSPIKFFSSVEQAETDIRNADHSPDDPSCRIIIAGDIHGRWDDRRSERFGSFGLEPEYALAAGLAVKGFIPELSPGNFLPEEAVMKNETGVAKMIFQRTALILGSFMLAALIVPFLASMILQKTIDNLDEELASSSAVFAEVTSLTQRVNGLETRLSGGKASFKPTNSAGLLHSMARNTPEGVWLEKLSIKTNSDGTLQLSISGFARQNEYIAVFLKQIESSGEFPRPRLLRTGTGNRGEESEVRETKVIKFEIASP